MLRPLGILSGDRDLHVVLDDGTIEFKGVLSYDVLSQPEGIRYLTFTTEVRGGSADGARLRFWLNPGS